MVGINVGIIGCGNMGGAIIEGILATKKFTTRNIRVFDTVTTKVRIFADKYNAQPQFSNLGLVKNSQVVILAVKPQDSLGLLTEIGPYIQKSQLIISIMAGVKISKIARFVEKGVPIVRVMPNISALVREAISGISYNKFVEDMHKKIVRNLFEGIGQIYETKESLQDAITALTGSGPAYFFYIVEAFINAAVKQGISRKDALKLVLQTMKGSASLLENTKLSPEVLRKKVTSKRGTTEAGIKVFDKKRLKSVIAQAVKAAQKRSKELSR